MTPEEVKQARLELGLSRSQLAVILDTDTRQIRRLEAEAGPSRRGLSVAALGWLMLIPLGAYWPSGWSAS